MLHPVWEGDIVYAESVMFVPNPKTGVVEPAPLFYPAEEILSVTSSDFMIKYKKNSDYYLENGRLVRTPDSRMPVLDYDMYYLKEPDVISIASAGAPGRYVRYGPGGFYHRYQVAVTYRHTGHWRGSLQESAVPYLPETFRKLKSGAPLKILIYGDSLMEGCDVSGRYHLPPYLPSFTALFLQWLRETWPQCSIADVNTAVGGTNSDWGLEQAADRVAVHEPDLVLINFGMNDSGDPILPERYEANIRGILETVRRKKTDAEFLLLTPGVASPDCLGWTKWQPHYRPVLERIQADTPGAAIIRAGEAQAEILKYKRYDDITANGVNHLNDFMTRIYAQLLIRAMAVEVSGQ